MSNHKMDLMTSSKRKSDKKNQSLKTAIQI